jgi:G3E family GTPase
MDKKIAGLLGAMASIGALNSAQAAPSLNPTDILQANSFAELLEPIPDAAARLKAVDASQAQDVGHVQLAQYYYHHHHHHHHHHHGFYRRYDEPEVVIVPRYRRPYYHHHHHHHHHHHSFYRRDYW